MAPKKSHEDQRVGAEIVHGAEECHNHSLKLLDELGFPSGILPPKELEEFGLVHADLTKPIISCDFKGPELTNFGTTLFKLMFEMPKWDTDVLYYGFHKGFAEKFEGSVRRAFDIWKNATFFNFIEDNEDTYSDISMYYSGIDGPSGTIAQVQAPRNGRIIFDSSER
ncbi:Protein of unknown function- DUF538 [Striga hermonthica]|uniref:Uncharacterized protein n=1 Tax=Striga hermonthica TaxID=68872 RepID=A0A9N7R8U6_STRHE|nr:Protein of unknown function- DUF538 [Striga hermonthica]